MLTNCVKRKLILVLVLHILSPGLYAQLCDGSLGDPVVNITFGSGGQSSSFVPAASYAYTSSTCPDDGYYTITTATSNCFGDTWHNLSNDHTGGGAFMLVNASYAPGDFFVTTVTDLCPNTTYEFAAWVMNVMKPTYSILPNLTFNVETPDGVVLNTFSTGDIPVTGSPQWKQYGFYFSTPPISPVIILRITNNAPGGNGNDLAIDDITFRPCGSKIAAGISGISAGTVDFCQNDVNHKSYSLHSALAPGYISPLIQWQQSFDDGVTWHDIPGADALNYTTPVIDKVGSYWYRMTVVEANFANVSSCKIASDIIKINVHPTPLVSAGPDKIMLGDNPVILSGKAEGDQVTFTWLPDNYMTDGEKLNPKVSPPVDYVYVLSAENQWGCKNIDSVNVRVVRDIYVPNVFTPNGDGKNDQWKIPSLDPSFGGEVSVFNRWGQMVYHISSGSVSWDGRFNGEPQQIGIYTYIVTIKQYGIKLRGTVRLMR